MRYLLDTSIFIWMIDNPQKLGPIARRLLTGDAELFLSAASCWELAIKTSLGTLELNLPLSQYLDTWQKSLRITPLSISQAHAMAVTSLPFSKRHKDPFDRLLVAQASAEQMILVTADRAVASYSDTYPLEICWAGK